MTGRLRSRKADPKQVHYAHIRADLWSPLCTDQCGWVAPLARYMEQVTCEDCKSRTEAPE